MSWANLDDRLHAHPKVQELQAIPVEGIMAFGLWAWALSWCRAYSPDDGAVPVKAAARAWNTDPEQIRQLVDRLVEVGMAERDDRDSPTWTIHDWCDWQMDQHQRAGRARAATGERDARGRLLPSALEPLVTAGASAGPPAGHATPRHSTPRLSTRAPARGDDGFTKVVETAAVLGFHPVPKPEPKPKRMRR